MSDVFILGTGFSKAISRTMPDMKKLSRDVLRVSPALRRTHLPTAFRSNIEMWLTHLALNHPWLAESEFLRNRALFVEVSRKIGKIIGDAQERALKAPACDWVVPVIEEWHRTRVAVLTFNYDTLVEWFAERTPSLEGSDWPYGLCWLDFFPINIPPAGVTVTSKIDVRKSYQSFRLYKLHGSIDWLFAGRCLSPTSMVCYSPVKSCRPPDEDKEWARTARETAHMTPLIVPPLTEKTAYYEHWTVQKVWDGARHALGQATRVFCLGYSLPESDLTTRLFLHEARARRAKLPRLYVVNKDKKIVARYRELLGSAYDVNGHYASDGVAKFAENFVNGRI